MALAFGTTVIEFEPSADLFANMPGGIVPKQEKGPLAFGGKVAGQPGQISTGDGTDGTIRDKA